MPIAQLIDLKTLRITAEPDFHDGKIFQASLFQGTTDVALTFIKQEQHHFFYALQYTPGIQAHLKVNNGFDTPIYHQLWLHTNEFAELFHTTTPLGTQYHKTHTVFRVWAPTAYDVELRLYQDDLSIHFMTRGERGVYETTVQGDLEDVLYTYVTHVEGKLLETIDPYAWTNAFNSTRSIVVNPDKLTNDVLQDLPVAQELPTQNIIYELSVRDFSIHGAQFNKGKYIALEEECSHDVRYLKGLGVTHIQLLPVYDFGSVWEQNNFFYNWGYDPVQFNTVEGSYATSPNDSSKLLEFQRMIKALHNQGLRVVMDMVFNHVFSKDAFMWERLVPGYFFRHNDTLNSNGSFCGNDVETRQSMVRRYIIDTCLRFVNHFGVDGFRLDLMGLIDITTINELRAALDEIDPTFLLYGEGWQMFQTFAGQHELATIPNHAQTPRVGYFNDLFRNRLKQMDRVDEIYQILSKTNRYLPIAQSINYVECHDNETLFDALHGDFERHQLLTMLTLLSPGIPFLQAGQEFFRTKGDVENSYCSPDSVNALDWSRQDRYRIYTEFVRQVIKYRLAHPALTHPDARVTMVDEQGLKIFHYEYQNDSAKLVLNLTNRKILRPIDAHLYSHVIESVNIHVPEVHAYTMICL
jgi:pullulanase